MKFNAAVVFAKDELHELFDEGVKVRPMQWIETDKNAHRRRDKHFVKVPRLSFEDIDGICADSPTVDAAAHNLVLSWAAQAGVCRHHQLIPTGEAYGPYPLAPYPEGRSTRGRRRRRSR